MLSFARSYLSRVMMPLAIASFTFTTSEAAGQSGPAPIFVTSHLSEGVVHDRLVPLVGAKASRNNGWTIERRFTTYRGTPSVIQVMTVQTAGSTTVDSLLFDRATLRPVWDHSHGALTMTLAFAGTHVTGRIMRHDSADVVVNLTTEVPAFSGATDDVVVQSVPLARGYQVVLPFIGAGTIEIDTIRVRRLERVPTLATARSAWAVDLSYPSGSETLWIDPVSRAILRHIYTIRKDHSQLEVVAN